MNFTKITLALFLNLYFSNINFSQSNQYLLITAENTFSVQELEQKSDFIQLRSDFNIHTVEQAFSHSKKQELRNVFLLKCDCFYQDLVQAITNDALFLNTPEIVQETELLSVIPNDYNLTFSYDYSLDLIRADEAWEISTGNSDIVIGITDSNFDINHQELQEKINYVQPVINNPNVLHGTAVAASAAGATDNAKGKSSIGYNSSLTLHELTYNGALNARNQGARIINMSWASSCFYVSYHQSVIDELFEDGVILVAAAGNGTTCGGPENLVYPAAYNNVIAVTSIGPTFQHEQFEGNSNSTHQHNSSVDIAAPGYNVPLAFPNNSYGVGTGTSFAAPLVSGTIGLMLAVNESLNHCEVEQILKHTAYNIDSLNEPYAGQLGAGALDAFRAVERSRDFINTSVYGAVIPDPTNPQGMLDILVSGDAIIDNYYAELVSSDTLQLGNVINNYEVYVTYESGCIFKLKYTDSEAEYFDDSIIALPVEELNVSVEQTGQHAEISWSTESEANNSHFVIYKSIDGINWNPVHTQLGLGNSTSRTEYSYLENDLLRSLQYYRIHQYDFNGGELISDIVALEAQVLNRVTLFPNPSSSMTHLSSVSEIKHILIYDQTGKTVRQLNPNSTEVNILTESLSSGLFYVDIELEDGAIERKKLIITD